MDARTPSRDLAAGLVVLLAAGLLFGALELARPGYFLWNDNATFFLPSYLHTYRALSEAGELAHVNFHQYLGQMHLGNSQSGVLYPPVYVAIWLAERLAGDPLRALDLLAVGHFLLAGLGMLVLLRSFGCSRPVAVLASLVWISFPFLIQVARNWIFVSYTAALLPWNLWLLERLVRAPGWRTAIALGALKAVLFYQGYPQYALVAALFDVVYLLCRLGFERPGWRRTGTVAVAYGAALLACGAFAAPLLVPILDVRRWSALRAGDLPVQVFLANPLPPATFLKAQLFTMLPRVVHHANGAVFYVGLPLLLAFVALLFGSRRLGVGEPQHRACVLTALAGLLASTVLWIAVYPLPVFSSFRWPFKNFLLFLFFLVPALAMLAERRRGLGVVLLGMGLVGNLTVLATPAFNSTFGPERVDRPVAELRAEAAARFPLERGRVASLWMRRSDPDMVRRLTFNFATLVGAYHLAGYDPLIASENFELALGLEVHSIYRRPLHPALLTHLSAWNVRYFIVPARPEIERSLATLSTLALLVRDRDLLIYENLDAAPWARFVDREHEAVPVTWGVNEVRIDPGGRAGKLRLALASLPWYEAEIDGRAASLEVDPGHFLTLEVPHGARSIVVRFVDVPFRLGVGIFASTVLALLLVARLRA